MKIGDKKYRVQWCTKYAFDENGDHDHDRDEWTRKDFESIDEARTFASAQRPIGWGCVTIESMTLREDPYAQRGEPSLVWRYDEDGLEEIDVEWRLPEGPHGVKMLVGKADKVATSFDRRLAEYLGADTMRELIRRTQEKPDTGICHSGDFCDSNVFMGEAIQEHIPGLDVDLTNDAIYELWIDAWDLAIARWKKVQRGGHERKKQS